MTKITSETYDSHIVLQGPQHQIDAYYEPKEVFDRYRIDLILTYLAPQPGEKILDIGSGVGTFAFHCAKRGAISIGVDYSRESMKMSKVLCGRYALKGRVNFVIGEAMSLPFPGLVFDKIAAVDFIEHITFDEKNKLLSEIRRVLKNGGQAVIFTPNKIREDIGSACWNVRRLLFGTAVPFNKLHYGLITRKDFEKLLKQHGFVFKFHYLDLTRPYLARIPFLNRFLSLNLLWVISDEF